MRGRWYRPFNRISETGSSPTGLAEEVILLNMWANLTCTYRSPTQKNFVMKVVIFKFLDALARFTWILREIHLERLNSLLDRLASKFAP